MYDEKISNKQLSFLIAYYLMGRTASEASLLVDLKLSSVEAVFAKFQEMSEFGIEQL